MPISGTPSSTEAAQSLKETTADQKYRLEQICWDQLATITRSKVQTRQEELMEQMANGEINSIPTETEIEQGVLNDLLSKIQSEKTSDQIEDVKEELAKHLDNKAI